MEAIALDVVLVLISFILAFGLQKIVPKLFSLVPISIVSGFILISFKGLDFSLHGETNFYTDLLLAFIFGSFPLSLKSFDKKFFKKVIPLWQYSVLQYLIQWGGSILIVCLFFKYAFNLGPEFSAYLPSGFAGGHGSAAVVGDLLQRYGIENALSFTMFCATVGILLSVIGGIFWAFIFKKKFKLRSLHKKNQEKFYIRDFGILGLSVAFSFLMKPFFYEVLKIDVPGFVIAVLFSFIFRKIFGSRDPATLNRITNVSTDILVIVGMGAIKFNIISLQLIPLLILFGFALLQGILIFKFLSFRAFKEDAFEKALFTWGWSIGGLVIGLNLVQSLESDKESNILDEFAMTYLLLSPCEISLLLLGPWLLVNGYALYLGGFLVLMALIIITLILRRSRSY